jgi:hypothetical protein
MQQWGWGAALKKDLERSNTCKSPTLHSPDINRWINFVPTGVWSLIIMMFREPLALWQSKHYCSSCNIIGCQAVRCKVPKVLCPSVLWIRKYFFRIRILGSIILNYKSGSERPIKYKSGSERPIKYDSGRVRILSGHFCGHR